MTQAPPWIVDLVRPHSSDACSGMAVTPSSTLYFFGDVVAKLHRPGTIEQDLRWRLSACDHPSLLSPLVPEAALCPDGLLLTLWPRVATADPDSPDQPWAEAGHLLGQLHSSTLPDAAPASLAPSHGWLPRLARAIDRAPLDLRVLGESLMYAALGRPEPDTLIHGDWHLGQLGRTASGKWLLIDADDIGLGSPAWDLARPAGFRAAGLMDDASFDLFLDAYRDAGGTAVPVEGDPWSQLDLPARIAVYVAASSGRADPETARDLIDACRRMAP